MDNWNEGKKRGGIFAILVKLLFHISWEKHMRGKPIFHYFPFASSRKSQSQFFCFLSHLSHWPSNRKPSPLLSPRRCFPLILDFPFLSSHLSNLFHLLPFSPIISHLIIGSSLNTTPKHYPPIPSLLRCNSHLLRWFSRPYTVLLWFGFYLHCSVSILDFTINF